MSGRWYVDELEYGDGRKELCICDGEDALAVIKRKDVDHPFAPSAEEAARTARLMASAQRLLAVAKDLLPFVERYCSQNGLREGAQLGMAREVIAEATGEAHNE